MTTSSMGVSPPEPAGGRPATANQAEDFAEAEQPLWRDSRFRRFWYRQAVSELGTQITQVAFPLVAVLTLNAGTLAVAVISASRYMPFVVLSVPAGALADHFDRRKLLIIADIGRAVLIAAVPIFWATGNLTVGLVVVIALLSGAFRVLFDIAYQSYVPSLVSPERVVAANAVLSTTESVARVSGPGLAGFIISVLSAPLALIADACSFVISAFTLARLRSPSEAAKKRSSKPSPLVGFRLIRRQRKLLPILTAACLSNFALMLIQSVVYVRFNRALHLDPSTIGLIMAFSGLGGVVGNSFAQAVGRRTTPESTMVIGYLLTSAGTLGVATATGGWIIAVITAMAGYFMWSMGLGLFNVHALSYRQRVTESGVLGRLTGAYRMLLFGSLTLGGLLGGVIGQVAGTHTALYVGAGLNIFSLIALMPVRFSSRFQDTGAKPV